MFKAVFFKSTIKIEAKIVNKQKRLVTVVSMHELEPYLFIDLYKYYKENAKNVQIHHYLGELILYVSYGGTDYKYYLNSDKVEHTLKELEYQHITVIKL